ncbi:MAG: V-type ATP synthase subunit C [Methanomicrobiales archaeon 53_19]|uniref:ATP synthase A1 subunit C n=1 Tax=Methanocalculus sp. TaxID=2004547 RepID=UPI0007480937|nr:ATP synthase A1 subunit C [Methanocalculus sp.]KUL02893.1 MAG: V-type ATP synthase subunit C [Methanomicrobiales archaeon 53_19]
MDEMDYSYANARIRAMKSRLLDHHALNELTNKPDIDTLIASLEETAYKNELQKAGIEHSGILQVETALRRDLVYKFRQILRFFLDEDEKIYIRIILNRWDLQNIKTILRGKKINAHHDEIEENLVPAGELDYAALIEFAEQPDIRAVIDLLATWRIEYARPLTRRLQEYLEKRDLAILEFALDRFYLENARRALTGDDNYSQGIVLDLLKTEIDVANIRMVLRVVRDRIHVEEPGDYLIEGGKYLSLDQLVQMLAARSIEEVVKELIQTPYAFLAEVGREDLVLGRISVLERELERFMIKKGCSSFLKDPMSIAIPVGYIWAKQNEVTNIRIIARSILGQVPEKEMQRVMTYV